MCLLVAQGGQVFFQEKSRCLNLVLFCINGFAMIHHGLILWESGATPLGIIFAYLPDLNMLFLIIKRCGIAPLGLITQVVVPPELGIPSRDTVTG